MLNPHFVVVLDSLAFCCPLSSSESSPGQCHFYLFIYFQVAFAHRALTVPHGGGTSTQTSLVMWTHSIDRTFVNVECSEWIRFVEIFHLLVDLYCFRYYSEHSGGPAEESHWRSRLSAK